MHHLDEMMGAFDRCRFYHTFVRNYNGCLVAIKPRLYQTPFGVGVRVHGGGVGIKSHIKARLHLDDSQHADNAH